MYPRLIVKSTAGFTLVEITLAIGIVGFCLLALLGLLPVGLNTVRDSMVQVGESGIARQLRVQLEQVSPNSIAALTSATNYYTQQGVQVSASDADFKNAYYSVTFQVNDPVVAGSVTGFNTSAKTVTATLHYPQAAPAAQRQTKTFSLLASLGTDPLPATP